VIRGAAGASRSCITIEAPRREGSRAVRAEARGGGRLGKMRWLCHARLQMTISRTWSAALPSHLSTQSSGFWAAECLWASEPTSPQKPPFRSRWSNSKGRAIEFAKRCTGGIDNGLARARRKLAARIACTPRTDRFNLTAGAGDGVIRPERHNRQLDRRCPLDWERTTFGDRRGPISVWLTVNQNISRERDEVIGRGAG
jgi:hypothetical protein